MDELQVPDVIEYTDITPEQKTQKAAIVLRRFPGADRLRKLADQHKPLRKKLLRGGTAAAVGLSITLAGLFQSPSDMMIQQQTIRNLNPDYAVEIVLEDEDADETDDKRKAVEPAAPGGFFARSAQAVRNFVAGLPELVKACVCVPLWGAGYVIIHLASLLFRSVVSPVLGHIIGWLLFALMLLAVYTVTMKCVFPHMPLRKILSWKNILRVLAGAAVLKILDFAVPVFWDGYFRVRNLILFITGSVIVFLIVFRRIRSSGHKL